MTSHQALASSPCSLVRDEERPTEKKKRLEGQDFVPGIFPWPLNLNSVNLFIICLSYMR